MAKKDFYDILGVPKTATAEEIKKAYRKKAKEHHPDSHTAENKKVNEEKFKEASEAYSVLSDDAKRQQYDRFGPDFQNGGFGGGQGAGGFSGGGFDFSGFSNSGMGFDIDLDDILGSVFGGGFGGFGGSKKNSSSKGADLRYNMRLTFEESVFGVEKEITISRNEKCSVCSGTGAKTGTKPVTCDKCNGAGKIKVMQNTIMGAFAQVKTCDKCGGEGTIYKETCETCLGKGTIKKSKKIEIKIPAGIDDGQAISLRGEGDTGKKGGPNGDLFVVVTADKHRLFNRRGHDIYFNISVPFVKVTLGGEIKVPTLEGDYYFTVPVGTNTGTTFVLKNRGIPNIRGGNRGNLEFTIEVETPKKLTDHQKELLEQFAISTSEEVGEKKKNFFGRESR